MQWNSAAEFFAMGGYGIYVWGAYGVSALLIAAELVILIRRGRTLRKTSGRSPRLDDRKS
jgi:heme exporter protein D